MASVLPDLRSQSGVVVAAVLDYEPPISADLAAGDVIRSFKGQSLSTVGELRKHLKKLKPGDAAVLEVERQGCGALRCLRDGMSMRVTLLD